MVGGRYKSLVVTFASAIVQTLLPKQEGASYAKNSIDPLFSKVTTLEMRFADAKIDIIGVQEGGDGVGEEGGGKVGSRGWLKGGGGSGASSGGGFKPAGGLFQDPR